MIGPVSPRVITRFPFSPVFSPWPVRTAEAMGDDCSRSQAALFSESNVRSRLLLRKKNAGAPNVPWPCNTATRTPVAAFQIHTEPSSDPAAIIDPSGLNSDCVTRVPETVSGVPTGLRLFTPYLSSALVDVLSRTVEPSLAKLI